MNGPDITAVIVAWNSAALLGPCVGSLKRSARAARARIETIVIDNGSADGSSEAARREGADVVVENSLNAGFVVAASQGIALARSEWILLVNPDVAVSDGFLATVLEAARCAPRDVAALVPEIRFASDPSLVNSRGIEVDEIGVPSEAGVGRPAEQPAEAPTHVFGATSACCVLRAQALEEVGGLEPAYFAYLEDVDVAWRLGKAGRSALFLPDAHAFHRESASTAEQTPWLRAFLVARNRRILFRLHGPHGLRARGSRAVTDLGHAAVETIAGGGSAPIRGRIAALRSRRYLRFLRASREVAAAGAAAAVPLAPRAKLGETLRRRQARLAAHRESASA